MKLKDILMSVKASIAYLEDESILERQYQFAFASDLMSDALALVREHQEETLFITGLNHEQTIRTAEMLDFNVVIFVRGKIPSKETVALAKANGISLFYTEDTMFQACGKIYEIGVKHS